MAGPDLISFIYKTTSGQGLGHSLELPTQELATICYFFLWLC